VQAALNARVRSSTKSSRLSESRRSTSDSASGSTAASRSLRQAANAVTRASSSSFFRALPALRAPALELKAWTAHPPPIRRLLPTSGPGTDRDRQRSPPPNDARQTVSPSVRGLSQPTRFCGKLARSTSSTATSSPAATATDALWGSTPIKTFSCARTSVFGWISATTGVREGHADFGPCSLIPLLRHSARRSRQRDASLEQANPLHKKGGRNFASDPYNRRPRSLAAADYRAPARS
jgi:hypothetical protein